MSAVFGRVGVVAPRRLVGVPLDPARLCDTLMGADCACFFAPSLGGATEAASAQTALASELGFVPVTDGATITARYKHARALVLRLKRALLCVMLEALSRCLL